MPENRRMLLRCDVLRSALRPTLSRAAKGAALLALLLVAVPVYAQRPATALSPVEALGRRYQALRERALTEDLLRRFGAQRPVLPPVRIPLSDSVLEARLRGLEYQDLPVIVEPLPPPFSVTVVTKVPRFGLPAFEARFGAVPWSFLGNTFSTAGDTMRTARLRGALQSRYGAPTRTLGDLGGDDRVDAGSAFQFEYWFAINDTIPLLVTDVGGPRDRSLVVATHARLREWLPTLRSWLLGDLAATRPEPYADYYYSSATRAWSVVGFDGVRYVERTIPRPDIRVAPRPLPSDLRSDRSR